MKRAIKTISVVSLAALAGCGTPATERYYRLDYPVDEINGAAAAAESRYELIVDSVRIPEAVNRPQLVLQKSATEAVLSDDQRWVAPLDEQIAQALVANLRSRLPGAWLATGATAGPVAIPSLPRYRLKLQVEQLLIQDGDRVTLEATWILRDGGGKALQRERAVINVPVKGAGYAPVAPAVSEAVRQLSAAVAQGMQAARAL